MKVFIVFLMSIYSYNPIFSQSKQEADSLIFWSRGFVKFKHLSTKLEKDEKNNLDLIAPKLKKLERKKTYRLLLIPEYSEKEKKKDRLIGIKRCIVIADYFHLEHNISIVFFLINEPSILIKELPYDPLVYISLVPF